MSDHSEVLGQIDRYELVREIGRGGMATVFLARQTGLKRLVALKRLNGVQLGDGSLAERFARESQLTAQLAHERIVTVHDFFEVDGTPFIAMEYLPGGSLRPHVRRLTHDQALSLLADVLEGLSCAEEHGVVHRDLKPENILLTTNGHAKIADFGIAKAIGELTGATGLTATGLALGTPTYMAPEQALGRPVTPATDRYALGVIAYEIAIGSPPYTSDDTPMALLYQHVNAEPRSLVGAPGVDEAMARWIERLLSKDPAERFADNAEALEHLRRMPRTAASDEEPRPEAPPAPADDYATWAEMRRPTPDPVVIPPAEDTGVHTPVGEVVELADTPSSLGFVQGIPEPVEEQDTEPLEEEPAQETVALTAAPQRPPPEPPPDAPGPTGRDGAPGDPGRRRGALIAAAGLAAVAVVAAIVIALGSGGDDGGGGGGSAVQPARAYAFGSSDLEQIVASVDHVDSKRVVVIHDGSEDHRPSDEIDFEEAGLSEPADEFGWSLAGGDFNRDGRADLAIGTNVQNVVSIGYGKPGGGFRFTTISAADTELPPGAGKYGYPLVAADYDGNGYADLAVGAAGGEDESGSGAIQLLFGGPEGLTTEGAHTLTLDGVSQFGRRLRAADVDGDDALDLVEGAPDTTVDGHVSWCRGGPDGPRACVPLEEIDGELDGATNVATGDLDGDGFDEIIVGDADQVAEEPAEQEEVAGELRLWRGSDQGPIPMDSIDKSVLEFDLVPGDRFGAVTDAGDIDGSDDDEVVVGAPGRSCAYVVDWPDGLDEAFSVRELVRCEGAPENLGSSLAVLDVTPAKELDVVVGARHADDPEERLRLLPGGATELRPLEGIMSNGRGTLGDEITVGRRAGGGLQ